MKEDLPPMALPSEMTVETVERMIDFEFREGNVSDTKAIIAAVKTLACLQLRMHQELIRAVQGRPSR